MISFYELRYEFVRNRFTRQFHKNIANGKFKKFDEDFYRQFNGMYDDGLPVNHYLQKDSLGKCFETSLILALALRNDNIMICRGILTKQSIIEHILFDHAWLEIDNLVYDTTWHIIADKETYYKVFGAICESKESKKEYLKNPLHRRYVIQTELPNKKPLELL